MINKQKELKRYIINLLIKKINFNEIQQYNEINKIMKFKIKMLKNQNKQIINY